MNPRDQDHRLPVDPDVEVEQTTTGAARIITRLRAADIVLVLAGGTVGTATREGLRLTAAGFDGVVLVTAGINVVGAFLLGVLLESLAGRGPHRDRRRTLRLLLGTGFLGGFTTYSALATDTALLVGGGPPAGVGLALGTVMVGALATWSGIAAAATRRGPKEAGLA